MPLDHPRIVKLRESWNTANEIILVLELVSGGELFDYLAEREQLTENEAAGIIKQVLETISYMHELKIAHFDLKPENVMCLPGNVPAGGAPKIKLVDFGLSQRCDLGIEVTAMHGTPEFVAPEVLAFEPIGLEADLWSIGVITYILLSGCSPFQGTKTKIHISGLTLL
jgi:serine/threonine protein kinase